MSETFTKDRLRLLFVVLCIGLTGFIFQLLRERGLNNSALLYIGIPFLLALGLCFTQKSKSTIGATIKGLTIAILLSAPVFGEGFVCIIMASPIFYTIAIITAAIVDRIRNHSREKKTQGKIQLALFSVFMSTLMVEGTHESLSFPRAQEVTYSKVIEASTEDIKAKLAAPLTFDTPTPIFLKLFPFPVKMQGKGLNVGDQRRLDFVYKKWITFNEQKGSMVFRIVEASKLHYQFDAPYDSSYLNNYLTFKGADILLEPINKEATKVTWTIRYQRKLDPAWYFGPMQKYAMWLTAGALIDNAATPKP